MKSRYFLFARILFVIVSLLLFAAMFVPFNKGIGGDSYALSTLFVQRGNADFWLEYVSADVANIYIATISVAACVAAAALIMSLIKDPKVFRVLTVGVFALSAMYFAFALGALYNLVGAMRAAVSFNSLGLGLSCLALLVGLRVTIDKSIEKGGKPERRNDN